MTTLSLNRLSFSVFSFKASTLFDRSPLHPSQDPFFVTGPIKDDVSAVAYGLTSCIHAAMHLNGYRIQKVRSSHMLLISIHTPECLSMHSPKFLIAFCSPIKRSSLGPESMYQNHIIECTIQIGQTEKTNALDARETSTKTKNFCTIELMPERNSKFESRKSSITILGKVLRVYIDWPPVLSVSEHLGDAIAIPTNDWWGNLLAWKDRQESDPVFASPYTHIVSPTSLSTSYLYQFMAKGPSNDNNAIKFYFYPATIKGVIFGAEEFDCATNFKINGWDDIGVRLEWSHKVHTNEVPQSMQTYLATGAAFTTVHYVNLHAKVSFGHAIVSINQEPGVVGRVYCGKKLVVSLNNNQQWTLYILSTKEHELIFQGDHFTTRERFTGALQAAILLHETSEQVNVLYDSVAGVYVSGGRFCFDANGSSTSYDIEWDIRNCIDGQKETQFLHFALEHHMKILCGENLQLMPMLSLHSNTRGRMRAFLTRNTLNWHFVIPTDIDQTVDACLQFYSPREISMQDITHWKLCEILQNEIEAEDWPNAKNPEASYYFRGKTLQKIGTLCLLSAKLAILTKCPTMTKLAVAIRQTLKQYLLAFAKNESCFPLVYDTVYKGIVSSEGLKKNDINVDFGSLAYNDHHYHYGYFITATAILLFLDTEFAQSHEAHLLKSVTESLIHDVANTDSHQNPYFPSFRNFNWFYGHSYSHGITPMADGKDIESMSEDINFSYGLALYGYVVNDARLHVTGSLMMKLEALAISTYFFITEDNVTHPPEFRNNKVTGMLFDNKCDYATWFSPNKECIHGIQMLPIIPAMEAIRRRDFVQEEWNNVLCKLDPVKKWRECNSGWTSLLFTNYSLIDKNEACKVLSECALDDGLSRAWALYFAYSQRGTMNVWKEITYGRTRPDGVEYFDFEVKMGVVEGILSISRGKLYEYPPPTLLLKYGSFPTSQSYDQVIPLNDTTSAYAIVIENLRLGHYYVAVHGGSLYSSITTFVGQARFLFFNIAMTYYACSDAFYTGLACDRLVDEVTMPRSSLQSTNLLPVSSGSRCFDTNNSIAIYGLDIPDPTWLLEFWVVTSSSNTFRLVIAPFIANGEDAPHVPMNSNQTLPQLETHTRDNRSMYLQVAAPYTGRWFVYMEVVPRANVSCENATGDIVHLFASYGRFCSRDDGTIIRVNNKTKSINLCSVMFTKLSEKRTSPVKDSHLLDATFSGSSAIMNTNLAARRVGYPVIGYQVEIPPRYAGTEMFLDILLTANIQNFSIFARVEAYPTPTTFDFHYAQSNATSFSSPDQIQSGWEGNLQQYQWGPFPYPRIGTWYFLIVANTLKPNSTNPSAATAWSVDLKLSTAVCPNPKACTTHGECSMTETYSSLHYGKCSCHYGYGGEQCGDLTMKSSVRTHRMLFLTLSNLAIVPVCVRCWKRKLYTESVFFTMTGLVSAIYHACDVEWLCLFEYKFLQASRRYVVQSSLFNFYISEVYGFRILFQFDHVAIRTFGGMHVAIFISSIVIAMHDPTSAGNWIMIALIAIVQFTVTLTYYLILGFRRMKTTKIVALKSFAFSSNNFDFRHGIFGVLTWTSAIICLFASSAHNYWIVHSFWHMSAMLAAYFFISVRVNDRYRMVIPNTTVDVFAAKYEAKLALGLSSPVRAIEIRCAPQELEECTIAVSSSTEEDERLAYEGMSM
uniref:glucan endo-1,3-beta-D-glucosidase n=1 Tax=Albugo laibachii Nc14 TaxID=890382 RepID=F0WH65_9STRA|nr:endo1 putative [Albugo laibachii Nc14]|eukprot:CCA20580.1 endo1 putative [Albugo laibachii Nc14]